jgi:rod shape-determining protein MreC
MQERENNCERIVMYKNKKTSAVGIIITIIILIILVILTNISVAQFSYTENIFNKIIMPVQNGLTYLKHKIAGNNAFFEDINNLKTENEKLKEEKEALEESLRELEIIKAENKSLIEYNNMSKKYEEYATIPAYIIDKNITNLSDIMVINAGTDSGVYENMAVISGEGLVGFVISSTNKTAKIQPIIDPASSVSSINSSRDTIIAKRNTSEVITL